MRQRKNVATTIDPIHFAAGLFGWHVCQRSKNLARGRIADAWRLWTHCNDGGGVRLMFIDGRIRDSIRQVNRSLDRFETIGDHGNGVGRIQEFGQTPIHHLHLTKRPHHYVVRLQIAMNDPLLMGVRHRLAQGLEDFEKVGLVFRGIDALAQKASERLSLNQLHGDERTRIAQGAHLVYGHHAGMLKSTIDSGLRGESTQQVGTVCKLAAHHLDCHCAVQQPVMSPINDAHATASDSFADVVTAGNGASNGGFWICSMRNYQLRVGRQLWRSREIDQLLIHNVRRRRGR